MRSKNWCNVERRLTKSCWTTARIRLSLSLQNDGCGKRFAQAYRAMQLEGCVLGVLVLQRDGGKLQPLRLDGTASEWSVPWPEWASRADGKFK